MRAKLASAIAVFTLLGLGTLVPGVAAQSSGEGSVSLPIGSEAPSVTLEDLDGNEVDLLELVDGQPALIEFWASWCEQCEALQPEIDRVQSMYGDEVRVVAVAVAVAQNVRRVRRHVEGAGHDYPFLYDAQGTAVRAYKAPTTSVVVMLDADGRVAYTGVGPDQDLVGAVERLLGS
ncbi:MAG: TlpA disulfide reductase family protein [Gemmatimonadota bacterium]|nr:TlpA disulfide reductase family protein [Gemmatimonadota bacterium]